MKAKDTSGGKMNAKKVMLIACIMCMLASCQSTKVAESDGISAAIICGQLDSSIRSIDRRLEECQNRSSRVTEEGRTFREQLTGYIDLVHELEAELRDTKAELEKIKDLCTDRNNTNNIIHSN